MSACTHTIRSPILPRRENGVEIEEWFKLARTDALILAVGHWNFLQSGTAEFLGKLALEGCVLDVDGVLDLDALWRASHACWRL